MNEARRAIFYYYFFFQLKSLRGENCVDQNIGPCVVVVHLITVLCCITLVNTRGVKSRRARARCREQTTSRRGPRTNIYRVQGRVFRAAFSSSSSFHYRVYDRTHDTASQICPRAMGTTFGVAGC